MGKIVALEGIENEKPDLVLLVDVIFEHIEVISPNEGFLLLAPLSDEHSVPPSKFTLWAQDNNRCPILRGSLNRLPLAHLPALTLTGAQSSSALV